MSLPHNRFFCHLHVPDHSKFGGYGPVGLLQSSLEYLHVQAHLPWWLAIVACTVALRVLMFPLIVRVQANAARLNNIQPQTEKLMEKIKRYNKVLRCNFVDGIYT